MIDSAAASSTSMGRSTVRALGNALAVFAAGDPVEAVFRQRNTEWELGSAGFAARDVTLLCCVEDLPAGVAQGSPVSVYWGNQTTTPDGHYLVVRRRDQRETGSTSLLLEVDLGRTA